MTFHLPTVDEMIAFHAKDRRDSLIAKTHYIEVNKGSKKNPKWVRHSEYPCRHDAQQAMFRDTLDIPAAKKRVTNADQSISVQIAIYPDDPKEDNE